jgi:serine/threonine protein kinase
MSIRKDEEKIYFCKYKTIKKIGEGSFGKIYKCVNILTNEKFAIKIVN